MLARLLLTLACWLLMTGTVLAQLDINTASPEQLDGLKGIGPTKAQAIVDYRRQHGPFKSIDELQNVPGIGPATLKEIRKDVTVSGALRPATVPPPKAQEKPAAGALAPAAPAANLVVHPATPGKPAMPRPTEKEGVPAVHTPAKAPVAAPAQPAHPASPGGSAHPATPGTPATPAKPAPASQPAMPARPAQPAHPPGY
jgi:competence protein ComEA